MLILGGALPGLAAGIRLAMQGHRVLVAEEDAAARTPDLLREPFHLPGVLSGGLLDATLKSLGIPAIERRRLTGQEIAYQVLLPDARIDVGARDLTARELVAWGLAKPEVAQELTFELERAAAAVQQLLGSAPILGRGALRQLGRSGDAGAAGLPEGVAEADGPLADFFSLQIRGLCELGSGDPAPEATARLLGGALGGGTATAGAEGGLISLLKRRLETLHAEFRTVGCPFEFVELSGHPGILRAGPGDVWLGRALIVNAPGPRLAAALREWSKPVPGFLEGPAPSHRQVILHLRALREVVPEALAPRALLAPSGPGSLGGPVRLAVHPSPRGSRFAEVVASAIVPWDDNPERVAQALEAEVRALMPFSDKRLKAGPLLPAPDWDDASTRHDAEATPVWPASLAIRSRSREPVVLLPREGMASLGAEGELLLGLRAGDSVREELG